MSIIACTVLVGWIIVLGLTLHRSFHTQHWKGAWVGFDLILLLAFAATGWAFWRGRQIVIACLIVTGTLLCCDAWFDVLLDAGTSDVWLSVASALIVELPLAFLMFNAARRLIRLSAVVAVGGAGSTERLRRHPRGRPAAAVEDPAVRRRYHREGHDPAGSARAEEADRLPSHHALVRMKITRPQR